MRLQVLIPIATAKPYGRGRIFYTSELMPIETSVRAVRRRQARGALDEELVEVDAYVPEHYRAGVADGNWLDAETIRTVARIADNRKTLAPLLASGETELCTDVH